MLGDENQNKLSSIYIWSQHCSDITHMQHIHRHKSFQYLDKVQMDKEQTNRKKKQFVGYNCIAKEFAKNNIVPSSNIL